MLALVNMAGLPTASNSVLNYFGFFNPSGWATSNLVALIIGLIIATAAIGIGASLFGRSVSESYLITGMFAASSILVMFIIDVGSVVAWLQSGAMGEMGWVGDVLGLFFGAIIVGYVFALIQYWRGNDI